MFFPSDILVLEAWQESDGALKAGKADNAQARADALKNGFMFTPTRKKADFKPS